MRLDLSGIIEVPGGKLPFKCGLDEERIALPSVAGFLSPPYAEGEVVNSAGALDLHAVIHADMTRVCDRCLCEYHEAKQFPVEAKLSATADSDDADIYPIDGDGSIDLSDILESSFILGFDGKSLCRPDCAGPCPTCGADLNKGKCSCKAQTDPRLAVLGQLLDDIQ